MTTCCSNLTVEAPSLFGSSRNRVGGFSSFHSDDNYPVRTMRPLHGVPPSRRRAEKRSAFRRMLTTALALRSQRCTKAALRAVAPACSIRNGGRRSAFPPYSLQITHSTSRRPNISMCKLRTGKVHATLNLDYARQLAFDPFAPSSNGKSSTSAAG